MTAKFSYTIQDNILVILPEEKRLDIMNSSSLKEEIVHLIQETGIFKVILNLSHLQFIDSSGLRAFLFVQRMVQKQGGILILAHLTLPIQKMLEVVSMHRIFNISLTTEEAIKSF